MCKYITDKLGIVIDSNRKDDDTEVYTVTEQTDINKILSDNSIIKLHYQDVCVMLNKTTADKFSKGKLRELPPLLKISYMLQFTRARGNVYFINE